MFSISDYLYSPTSVSNTPAVNEFVQTMKDACDLAKDAIEKANTNTANAINQHRRNVKFTI